MAKPDEFDLGAAEDTCWDLAKYIEEKWPSATREISVLKEASEILATHSSSDDESEGDENGESPNSKN